MSTQILSIGTAVPLTRLDQSRVRDFFIGQPGVTKLGARLIGAAFDQSTIRSRYSVIGDLGAGPSAFTDDDNVVRGLSTGERNAVYRREAPALFAAAARDALQRAHVDASEITQVVTASCTGFFSPGPDFLLVRELGIPSTAERTHIGFMGCSAAFPALRTAAHGCEARPGSTALVVCAELCSLHIRASNDPEQIVAASVFADGAAAAVVSSAPRAIRAPALDIDGFTTAITSEGEDDMDWTIGDHGFEMRLTANVPRIVGREIAGAVATLLGPDCDPRTDVDAWAVHPGGRSVLDRVQAGLDLSDETLAPSRAVAVDQHRPVRILDIGCGAGDVLRRLAGLARRDGYGIEALGIDPDPRALAVAREMPAPAEVAFRQADSRTLARAGERFDIVISNHLLHHLDAGGLAGLLADSHALATRLAVHSDIHRSSGALLAYAVGITPLAPGSLLRTDGMRSIRRSYTAAELARALPTGWHVERAGHFRLLAVHHPGEGRPGPHVKPLPNEIAPA